MQLYKFQIQVGQQLWEQFRDPNLLGLYFIDGEYALDYIYHFWLEGFAVFGIESYVPAGCDFLNDGLRYFAELSAFLLDSPEESFAVITLLYNELNNLGYILIIARLQIIQRLQRNLKDHLQILFPQTLVFSLQQFLQRLDDQHLIFRLFNAEPFTCELQDHFGIDVA